MDSVTDDAKAPGCPIRRSAGQRVLSPHRSLSQSATSFIASLCQGIHQMPFSCLRALHATRTNGMSYRIRRQADASGPRSSAPIKKNGLLYNPFQRSITHGTFTPEPQGKTPRFGINSTRCRLPRLPTARCRPYASARLNGGGWFRKVGIMPDTDHGGRGTVSITTRRPYRGHPR